MLGLEGQAEDRGRGITGPGGTGGGGAMGRPVEGSLVATLAGTDGALAMH